MQDCLVLSGNAVEIDDFVSGRTSPRAGGASGGATDIVRVLPKFLSAIIPKTSVKPFLGIFRLMEKFQKFLSSLLGCLEGNAATLADPKADPGCDRD
jgi:hypothetical protein